MTGRVNKTLVFFTHLFCSKNELSVRSRTVGPQTPKTYHIISSDKGYDGVIRTLKEAGITCIRRDVPESIAAAGESGADKSNCLKQPSVSESDIVSRWAGKLQQIAGSGAGNMPVSVETFNNYLKSHMRDEWNKTRAVAIRNELVRRGVTEVREKKIIWKKAKKENKA